MGGLVGGGAKKVAPPPVPPPTPIQTTVSPSVQRAAEGTRRRALSGRGRRGTILTQDEDKTPVLG